MQQIGRRQDGCTSSIACRICCDGRVMVSLLKSSGILHQICLSLMGCEGWISQTVTPQAGNLLVQQMQPSSLLQQQTETASWCSKSAVSWSAVRALRG